MESSWKPGKQSRVSRTSTPLVVELDTLIKTISLMEAANQFIARYPLRTWRLLVWWLSGKAVLKQRLVASCVIDPTILPYNRDVVQWLAAQKAEGRQIILATSSPKPLADLVAAHLGLFDRVLATNADSSAVPTKRDALIGSFGERGFDYLGSDRLDLPVCVGAAMGLSGAIGLALKAMFASSPGSTVRFQLLGQLMHYLTPRNYFLKELTYGVVGPRFLSIFTLVFIVIVVLRGWRSCSPALRQHLLIAAAINFPVFLLFAAAGELRNLSLLYVGFVFLLGYALPGSVQGRRVQPENSLG